MCAYLWIRSWIAVSIGAAADDPQNVSMGMLTAGMPPLTPAVVALPYIRTVQMFSRRLRGARAIGAPLICELGCGGCRRC